MSQEFDKELEAGILGDGRYQTRPEYSEPMPASVFINHRVIIDYDPTLPNNIITQLKAHCFALGKELQPASGTDALYFFHLRRKT